MKIQIEIDLNNAAFQDNPGELAQILEKIPHNMKPGDDGTLRDSNGNTVGHWEVNESF
jgi:hypothetical protein